MSISFDRFLPKNRQAVFGWLAILAIAFAVVRIVLSYHALNQVTDESGHIATGMQFIDKGKFTYETLHPTLGRAATAILPYLDGARSHGENIFWDEGNDILFAQGTYWRTLTLARLGILPFFILSGLLLWSWTKKLFGKDVAFLSVFFYTLVPPVLAHAGLATTDMPLTAGFLASCYALWWFFESPNYKRGIALGVVIGLSAATKFSFLYFFPPAAIIIAGYKFIILRRVEKKQSPLAAKDRDAPSVFLSRAGIAGLVLLCTCLTIWACFRFSFGPVPIANGTLDVTYEQGGSYPAPEFISGISMVMAKNDKGHATYFMGKPQYGHGSPWFFPVALAVKTPLAMLLFIALGVYLIASRGGGKMEMHWCAMALLPLFISGAMLAMVIPSNINIGIRHILPIYPFLAMLAALGAKWLWSKYGNYGRITVAALTVWMIASSVSSDPDRLAYFNEFASKSSDHPVLLDSDLDWGQDLSKLADTLHKRDIGFVDIEYFAPADIKRMGIPNYNVLDGYALPNTEWVAISKLDLYAFNGYAWLRRVTPLAVIGNSMILYHEPVEKFANIFAADTVNAKALAGESPSPDNFLNLSYEEFANGHYAECISAAEKCNELQPDKMAYNNIAAAYLRLGKWDSGIAACKRALQIDMNFEGAQKNLADALRMKRNEQTDTASLRAKILSANTPDELLGLSLSAYNANRFEDCIAAARKALKLKPDDAGAYVNICAAENNLGQFAEGKIAGEDAVRLDPNNQLAKNNLKWSIDEMNKKNK